MCNYVEYEKEIIKDQPLLITSHLFHCIAIVQEQDQQVHGGLLPLYFVICTVYCCLVPICCIILPPNFYHNQRKNPSA